MAVGFRRKSSLPFGRPEGHVGSYTGWGWGGVVEEVWVLPSS